MKKISQEMETISEIMNTQNSYSMPSPICAKQKKLFNSKVEYSILRHGHRGENDLIEDSMMNFSNHFDRSQNTILNISAANVPPFRIETLSKINAVHDSKRSIQDINTPPKLKILQTENDHSSASSQLTVQQQANQQKSIIKMWKLDAFKKEIKTQFKDKSPDQLTETMKDESPKRIGTPKSTILIQQKTRKSTFMELTNAFMTQEQMKIRCIFMKRFEAKRDLKIKKFLRILISRWRNRKLNLKEPQLNLIDDKAYFFRTSTDGQNFFLLKYLSLFSSSLGNACQFIPLLNPTNSWKLIWDIYMIICVGMFLYLYSTLVFFAQNEQHISSFYAKLAFVSLTIDIIFTFNTSIYSKDSIIKSRINIAKQYLRTTFVFDFISAFFLGLNMNKDNFVANYDNNIWIYIQNSLVLLKIASFQFKIKHLEQSVPMKEIWRHILSLVGLLTSIVTVAHVVAIIWNAIGQYEVHIGIQQNWQTKLDIQYQTWDVRYIYSLYWSVTTMFTIGYGDITPVNPYEVTYVTVVIIIVSTVFAYSINSIGIILSDIAKISKQYKEDLSIMNRFLNRKQVNMDLQLRVKKYLEFLAQEEKEVNKKAEDQVIDKLSIHLKDQLSIEVNTKILRRYPLFAKNFSERTLQRLVFIMKEVVVTPNELIITEGQKDDNALYLITKGEVEVYSLCDPLYQNQLTNKKVLAKLSKDQYFGEISFFTGYNRTANVRSLSLTTMYKITQQQMLDTLRETTDQDYEKFCMIRDQIYFGKFDSIQLKCYSCNEEGHISLECPQVTYDADRIIRIFRMNYSEIQEQKSFPRSKRPKKQSLKLLRPESNRRVQLQLDETIQDYLRRVSELIEGQRISFQSVVEIENEENDSKEEEDDSEEIQNQSENKDTLNEETPKNSNNNDSLNYPDEEKKQEKVYDEGSKRLLATIEINSDKIPIVSSNISQQPSRQSSDLRQKPKEIFKMKSRAQNTIVIKSTDVKSLQTIQCDYDPNETEKQSQQNEKILKIPSEFEKRQTLKPEDADINKITKQSSITTSTLLKKTSLLDRKESLHSQYLTVIGQEMKSGLKQDFIQKHSLEPQVTFENQVSLCKLGVEEFKFDMELYCEFDRIKIFKQYFPQFNYNVILHEIAQLKKKPGRLQKFRCKQFNYMGGHNKNQNSSPIIRTNKKILLQQIIKNKIIKNLHPIIYGAAGIKKYPK